MEVSTIIVKQKDLGCNATKVHIVDQGLEINDTGTKLFWKTLGGKDDVPGTTLIPKRFKVFQQLMLTFKSMNAQYLPNICPISAQYLPHNSPLSLPYISL